MYWSHCGSFRVGFTDQLNRVGRDGRMTAEKTPPLRSLDDVRALGKEVLASGHTALKTNIFLFDEAGGPGQMYMPGFGGGEGSPELNVNAKLVKTIVTQMRTFREACGDDIGLKLDINYNFKVRCCGR